MHLKKIRNLVIGGIENKVFNLILITVILLTAAFIGASIYQSNLLTELIAETNTRQQATITETTNQVIQTAVEQSMGSSTDLQAQLTEEMFQNQKTRVQMMAEYATKLFADPRSVQPGDVAPPDAAMDGQLSAHVLYAEGADPADPALAESLGLIANMADMMRTLCEAYGTDNAYITLPEGATLSVDKASGSWCRADGQPIPFDGASRFWYQSAAEAGGLWFSEVEIDQGTQLPCVTCAMPVYGPDGALRAVVGSDLFIDGMQRAIADSVSKGGYLAVVNANGHVLLSPAEDNLLQAVSAGNADLRKSGNTALAELITDALKGETDVRQVQLGGRAVYMAGAPMRTVGWALIAAYGREETERPAETLRGQLDEINAEATGVYREKLRTAKNWQLGVTIFLVLLVLAFSLILGKRIVKPLNTITKKISEIREGNLEFQMDDAYRTGDEIEVLAESFADISHKTVLYVDRVREVTAEKERIGTELSMATRIQESMLPHVFPAYPDRREFDLFAAMDPAREVGGDFYDFFLIDDDHLCLVMADVSGKGVPGALFMMISKVILQSCAMLGKSAAEILEKTNEALCRNDEVQMFVTVWLGILEISTGKLTAANAGHEYPVLCRKEDNRFTLFKDKHGFVIGGMEGTKYRQYELQLHRGDKLFVYTDGVPEATDSREQLFGIDRMLDALNTDPSASPQQVLRNVRAAVDGFVGSAEQFDDLTMLCLEYKGVPDA